MNVEEEYFQAIENRDAAIMMRDQRIEEQSNQIAEQEKALYVSAKALKQAGLSPAQISELTKLSIETIAEL